MAPEVLKKEKYTCKVDIWAVGVITFMILTGRAPFKGQDNKEILNDILTKNLDFSGSLFKNRSANCKDFLRKAMAIDPNQRKAADDLLAHPWIIENQDEREFDDDLLS